MNVDNLPLEVLHEIFKNLSGSEVLLCRKVCHRWTRAVDGLCDHFWEKLCEKEYPSIYEEAFMKASLSWTQLYKSFSLWPKVSDADVQIKEIQNGWTDSFEVLKDGVISCAQNYKKWDNKQPFSYNTIVYYKLATLEESQRECFDFYFLYYLESDKILLLQYPRYLDGTTESAKVLLKDNKKLYTLAPISIEPDLFLVNDRIYCSKSKQIMIGEPVLKDGNYTLETKHVQSATSSVVLAIGQVNKAARQRILFDFSTDKIFNGQIIIWTDDGTFYSLIGTVLTKICWQIQLENEFSHFDILSKLCSLKWSNGRTLNQNKFFRKNFLKHFKSEINQLYYYGKILIMSIRFTSLLHIFYGDENNGEISINEDEPDKVIDLSEHQCGVPSLHWSDIEQIDVVEDDNGHKIIVLYCSKILVIELSHND